MVDTSIFSYYRAGLKFLPNDKDLDLSVLETFADKKNEYDSKLAICFRKGRKHCGKGRKFW